MEIINGIPTSSLPKIEMARAPLATDSGYNVPTLWLDTLADNAYLLVDVTGSTATWISIGGVTDALIYKGAIDCSGNPNYPAADVGHVYKVSVAGKIGGVSGESVSVGDMIICNTDGTVSGTEAAVGAYWDTYQGNLSNPVAVSEGGTGLATITDHGFMLGSGTGAITPMAVLATGEIPVGVAGADPTVVSANISILKKVLTQTGTGSVGATPVWEAVTAVSGITVRNETGASIDAGKAVYVSGYNNYPLITLADNTVAGKVMVAGITTTSIAHEAQGFILHDGEVTNINTDAIGNVGQTVYLSTAGGLTVTRPVSGTILPLGVITVKHASTGKILITHEASPAYVAAPAATDIDIRMGDSVGVQKISFENYADSEVASLNSYGYAVFKKVFSQKGADFTGATVDLSTATGNVIDITTDTTALSTFGTVAAGAIFDIRFMSARTLTHNGTSFILPGARNVVTEAGDRARFISLGSGNWYCAAYMKANGRVLGDVIVATDSSTSNITADKMRGQRHYVTGAYTLSLPTAAIGYSAKFIASTAAVFSIDVVTGTDAFYLNGVLLTAGNKCTSDGTIRATIEVECYVAGFYEAWSNTVFIDGGA
jgi:hypothetical protein